MIPARCILAGLEYSVFSLPFFPRKEQLIKLGIIAVKTVDFFLLFAI